MATSSNEVVEVLNDLIEINNDRITGYQKASKELKDDDQDLAGIFSNMIDESEDIKSELEEEVESLNGEISTGTTGSGKVYRAWMDLKATFSGDSRHAILANCEYGEDAAQKAYRKALETENLPGEVKSLIINEQGTLKSSHDKIKALRDSAN